MDDDTVEKKLEELETDNLPKRTETKKCASCGSTDHVKSSLVLVMKRKGGKLVKRLLLCANCRRILSRKDEK